MLRWYSVTRPTSRTNRCHRNEVCPFFFSCIKWIWPHFEFNGREHKWKRWKWLERWHQGSLQQNRRHLRRYHVTRIDQCQSQSTFVVYVSFSQLSWSTTRLGTETSLQEIQNWHYFECDALQWRISTGVERNRTTSKSFVLFWLSICSRSSMAMRKQMCRIAVSRASSVVNPNNHKHSSVKLATWKWHFMRKILRIK